jgi:hypothetical protein
LCPFFVITISIESGCFPLQALAFRGGCGELLLRFAPLGVSPVTLIPQESRTLRSNQLTMMFLENKSFGKHHFIK